MKSFQVQDRVIGAVLRPSLRGLITLVTVLSLTILSSGASMAQDLIKETRSFNQPFEVTSLAISPKGDWVASSGTLSSSLVVNRTEDGTELARMELPVASSAFNSLAISHDGKYLAACTGARGVVRVFDTTSWRLLIEVNQPYPGMCSDLVFSPDSQLLAVAYNRFSPSHRQFPAVILYNTADWKSSNELVLQTKFALRVRFSAKKTLAVGTVSYEGCTPECGSITTWNFGEKTGEVSHQIFAKNRVVSLANVLGNRLLIGTKIYTLAETQGWKAGTVSTPPPTQIDVDGLVLAELSGNEPVFNPVHLAEKGTVRAIASSPSSDLVVAVLDSSESSLIAVDLRNLAIRQKIFVGNEGLYAASEIASNRLFAVSFKNEVRLYHVNKFE